MSLAAQWDKKKQWSWNVSQYGQISNQGEQLWNEMFSTLGSTSGQDFPKCKYLSPSETKSTIWKSPATSSLVSAEELWGKWEEAICHIHHLLE